MENNRVLNSSKTKEHVIDFRKKSADPDPLHIRDCVERVPAFKFLGTHIAEDLCSTFNTTTAVKKTADFTSFPEKQPARETAVVVLPLLHREGTDVLYIFVVCSASDRRSLQRSSTLHRRSSAARRRLLLPQ